MAQRYGTAPNAPQELVVVLSAFFKLPQRQDCGRPSRLYTGTALGPLGEEE